MLEKTEVELKLQEDRINESVHRSGSSTDPLQKKLEKLDEEVFGIKEKKELMRKWVVRLLCALSGKNRQAVEQVYQNKTFREMTISGLQELNKYTDRILGDEVH
jgi:hypothetical protein